MVLEHIVVVEEVDIQVEVVDLLMHVRAQLKVAEAAVAPIAT